MRKLLTVLAFLLIFLTACNQTSEIKITFIENGGVELDDLTIKTTDTSIDLPTPVREGYTFDGWFTDEDLTIPFTIASLLTQSGGITVYAKWTQIINQFTVTYQTNGGSTIAPVIYASGATIVAPAAPTREGYTFAGWFEDSALLTPYTFGSMPESNLTLYAKWTINQYTITFESNGGSTVTALTGDYQSTITKPANPTKVGYTFVDWYLEPALTTPYVFNQMGSSNLTLYAKWQINTYTVTFESNQGTSVLPITTEYNTTITQPIDPTKVGHTFGGWYSDLTLTVPFVFTSSITQSMTLYAKWNINSYTMTFNSMGGSPINPVTQNYGSQITVPNPAKEGYDFAGWYTSETYTTLYTVTTMPDTNTTVFAKWTASPYSITFNSNGGTVVSSISANYNDVVTKPAAPTKVGHTFVDWYSDITLNTPFVFTTMPVGGATLYAKWSVNEYTITFVVNGGTPIDPMIAAHNAVIMAPATTKAGYTFQGFYTEATFDTLYTFNQMGSSNITLYVKWLPIQYSIQFISNGGSEVDTIYGILDETITKPVDPTKQGHIFDGWYTESEFTTPFVFDKMPLEGATLFAKWMINTYTLTYIIEGSLINQEIAYQSQITLMTPPLIEGFNFVGWMENDTPFTLTSMPDRNITILPKYEHIIYTISFGNIVKSDMQVKYTDPIGIEPPTKPGYAFTGWFTDEFLLNEFTLTHMPANNIRLYALFEPLAIQLHLHIDETQTNVVLVGYQDKYGLPTPTKEGYQFLGWYLEDTFENKVYEIQMGLVPVHVYALWQIDEGYDLIEMILLSEPSDRVLVKGIITFIFPRPGFPGFYIYDGTANIFVLANPIGFVVGDVVEFEASYDNFDHTPQLINPTGMVLATGAYDLPNIITYSLEDVMRLDETNALVYGQRIILEAYLGYGMGGFYLQAPFSNDKIMINFRSIIDDSVLMPFINQTVIIEAYIHDYQSMAGLWHIAYIPNTIEVPTYTPEDIIDQVILLGSTQLDGKVFYPGAMLQLPNGDPTHGTTLDWSVIGENSAYFDIQTFTFQPTDIERTIQLQCVITLQGVSKTAVFYVILKPDTFVTYEALLNMNDNEYVKIKGIVLAHIPMISGTVVMLDGYTVFIPNNTPLNPGDEAVFVGYKQTQMGIIVIANDPNAVLVEVLQTGLPLPEATEIPLSVFVNLAGDNPLYWFKYVKLTGTLQFDPNSGYYFLTDGPYATGILSLDPMGNANLSMYQGMPVTLTGFTLMNFDAGGRLHFAFLNGQNDIEIHELTTTEKIDWIYFQLMNQFVHTFFRPGDTIHFPYTDKFYGSVITWHPVNDSANYIDLSTGYVDEEINQFIAVELEVRITLEGVTTLYTIFVHIEPMVQMTSIADLQSMPITTVTMEVIVITEPYNGFVIVGDQTGFMALYTNRNDIHVGYRIQVQGHLSGSQENILVNELGEVITMILDYENPDPTTTSTLTVSEFMNIPLSVLLYQYRRFEVTGSVGFNEITSQYYLVGEGNVVSIMPTTPDGMMTLHMNLNREVTLKGYALPHPTGNQLMFFNATSDIKVNLSNEMIVEAIQQQIIDMYDKVYRPGQQVYLETWLSPYYPEVFYELISAPNLYNMDFGYISENIMEITSIQFEVTIEYFGIITTFNLYLYVEPIEFSTVEQIQMAPLDSMMNLDAVVLFTSYDETVPYIIVGDATGYIVILGKHYYNMYDRVQFQGVVTTYQGEKALRVEAYQALLISSDNTPLTQPIPMTLYEAMQVNSGSRFMTYIVITGTVGREYNNLFLVDEDTQEDVLFANIYEKNVFYNYIGLFITIKGFIHYNASKSAPEIYYSGGDAGIHLSYTTEQEKLDALFNMGREHFEYTVYHPFENIDMPYYFGIFDAYLTYEILTGSEYLLDNMVQMVNEPVTLTLQVTALIGTTEDVVIYTIHIEPYDITSIIDVALYDDESFIVISGTVRAIQEMRTIIEDATGMIVLEGFGRYDIGDIILVYGYVNYVYGTVQVNAYGNDALSAVIGFDDSEPTLSEISLYETGMLDPNGASLAFYTTYYGVIENRNGTFFLTNAMYSIQLLEATEQAHAALLQMEGQLVGIQVYFVGIEMYGELWMTAVFTGNTNEYGFLQMTAEDITAEILNYALHMLDRPYYTEQVLSYPTEHPYFHGSIEIINDGLNASHISFNQGVVTVGEVTQAYQTDISVQVTYLGITYSQTLTITISPFPITSLLDAQYNHLGERVFLQVVISAMQYHHDTMVYVMDESGHGYFITMTNELHPFTGYEVIISGYVYEPMEGISYIDQVVIHKILSPIMIPSPMAIQMDELLINGELNTNLLGEVVTFTAMVMDYGMEKTLVQPGIQVVLVGNVLPAYQMLSNYQGQTIQITGILVGYRVDFMTQQIMPLVGYLPLV
jgi:uncharacterized repeat protein (TIGR02543 family)